MKFWSEFREFAVKGNMIDMAVGIIIGAAFSKIVDSLVRFVITPPLSLLTGKVHFINLQLVLRPELRADDGTVIREQLVLEYGKFLQATIDFFIISMTIFLLIKTINTMRKKAEDAKDVTIPTPRDIELLTDIRDLMLQQQSDRQQKDKN